MSSAKDWASRKAAFDEFHASVMAKSKEAKRLSAEGDHAKAATAHREAARMMKEANAKSPNTGPRDDDEQYFESWEHGEHEKKAAEHESKSGGGDDDRPRDEKGRFSSK